MKYSGIIAVGATIAALGISGVGNHVQAALIEVAQESSAGAGDFDGNVLGLINPFVTTLTASEFYNYSNVNESYNGDLNGGPAPVSNQSQVFFVDASDGLSLVIFHDARDDGSGGRAKTSWQLSNDTASILVKDDPGFDVYSEVAGTVFSADHQWQECCTDGYAIGPLSGQWTMMGEFTELPTNIDGWMAISSVSTTISLAIDANRRVRLRPAQPIPSPTTVALLATGLLGLGWSLRGRRGMDRGGPDRVLGLRL